MSEKSEEVDDNSGSDDRGVAGSAAADDDDDDDHSSPVVRWPLPSISDWFREEEEEEEDENEQDIAEEEDDDDEEEDSGSPLTSRSPLEQLSEDVAAEILQHLDLEEIARASLVSKRVQVLCRSNALWKKLLTHRWNVSSALVVGGEESAPAAAHRYFEAYQRAHSHPHDLWITHWNCAYPVDGLAPGRCCVVPPDGSDGKNGGKRRSVGSRKGRASCCPHCRIVARDDDSLTAEKTAKEARLPKTTAMTAAQAMAEATELTRRRRCSDDSSCRLSGRSGRRGSRCRRAFARAATFHRKLSTEQYERDGGSAHFLTDLLFFNLTDPATCDGQWELQQLLEEIWMDSTEGEVAGGGTVLGNHQTAHHSWHVIKLFNPDFYRPILYQIGVQRPDCFTVYPSAGYIEPGKAAYVTVGVRLLGSLLAYAFEALNGARDGLEAAWSDLYTEQAHLPMAPIQVRYHFAATQPAAGIATERARPRGYETAATTMSERQRLLKYHAKQSVPPHLTRSITLSAHVHAHYTWTDFVHATCQPWNVRLDGSGPVFTSPVLMEEHPGVFRRLENLTRVLDPPPITHTEGPCACCGATWGRREEELAQAWHVSRNETVWCRRQRDVLLTNVLRIMDLIRADRLQGTPTRLSSLLYVATCILQVFKVAPWTSQEQRLFAVQLEAVIDSVYSQIPVGGESWIHWRLSGVYRHAVCTDSVFGGLPLDERDIDAEWKDEPDYLEAFRHLAHSPGRYCLGPQEDPNHLGETVVSTSSSRYGRRQEGTMTDTFMGDAVSALQAGICMIRDPRSLLVHGLYDRIPYPGAVLRRPTIYLDIHSPNATWELEKDEVPSGKSPPLISSRERLAYYRLQNTLDLASIMKVDRQVSPDYPPVAVSLHNYLHGVPPPGVGRFPLSKEVAVYDEDSIAATAITTIAALDFEGEPRIASQSQPTGERQEPETRREPNRNGAARPQIARVGNNGGPRILQLLWILGAQLGLAVIDSPDASSVYVDRKILIASQWVSISFMTAPMFWTLFARYVQWIPTEPVDYNLEGLPFRIPNKMRFLSERECGWVALVVLAVWLALGRWTERNTSRDFFRVMMDHTSPKQHPAGTSLIRRLASKISFWCQRQWDNFCPLFLQRRVFSPHWNTRPKEDLLRHIACWRSRNLPEQRSVARIKSRTERETTLFGDGRDEGVDIGKSSSARKVLIGIIVALGSFCSSSPHFWLNLMTVFTCSISLGMSVSLHSIEKGGVANTNSTESMIKTFSVVTIVILGFLVGQLIGSSGGTMFLAEFLVTSTTLILGGAGTVSASAMESWGCFFCLSSTAFWGYLLGRVALLDGIRYKRGGYSSILLSKAVTFLFLFWVFVFFVTNWDEPVNLVIVHPLLQDGQAWSRKMLARKLQ